MMRVVSQIPGLVDRAWDSENFGLSVWEFVNPHASEAELGAGLEWCRQQGGGLVYWMAADGVGASIPVMSKYRGSFVDRKTTYERNLEGEEPVPHGRWDVKEIPAGTASEAMLSLGLAAGEFSRFNIDPRFPRSAFELLYTAWTERSARREIADVVLGAEDPSDRLAGILTIALGLDAAEIGLVAVSMGSRRLGLGGALMAGAHRWMRRQGARKARVVTQGANRNACSLYEKWGYSVASVHNAYHFWPVAGESR